MLELVITNKNQKKENELIPEEINDMNSRFQKLNNNLNFYLDNNEEQMNDNKNNINQINDNKSDMFSEDIFPQKQNNLNVNLKNTIGRNNKSDSLFTNLEENNKINMIIENETNLNKLSLMKTDYSNNNHINFTNENSFNINLGSLINSEPKAERNNSIGLNNTKNSLSNNINLNNSTSFSLEKSFDSLFDLLPTYNNNINISKDISSNMYSKRVVSELIKSDFDKETMKIIEHVSKIIDEKYLDSYIDNSPKIICLIQYFCCYIVEFSPEMLQNICPEYKETLKNFNIKFIVLAKELYNTTMEIFCTIYDLSFTNFNTFIELTKESGIQLEYAQCLYKIFREYSIMLLEQKKKKKNINNNIYIMNVLRKLFDNEYQNWNNIIKQKSNEFTNFFKS